MRDQIFSFAAASLLVATALAACTDEMAPGSLIERDRVLGARVEVEGDPGRAWPMPGERASVRWIVAGPDAPAQMDWVIAACVAETGGLGCAGEPFQIESGRGAQPVLSLAVPEAAALGDARALLVLAQIGETETMVTVPLALAGAAGANRSPALEPGAVTLDGEAWPALDPAEEPPLHGCAEVAGGAALPMLSVAEAERSIEVALRDTDREAFQATRPDGSAETRREALQLSHFTTAGELDRQFSIVEGEDPTTTPSIAVPWTPPDAEDDSAEPVPPSGLRVRFTFVLRDGRGGVDSTTRVACLVP